ncbi:hypothetical protein Ahy_A08g039281 [Arachis hypogaea]|uniref:PB1-like domain-containing protein n=1 Tax=Arachis hypogaea TaxID=3818 RepID=A0A445BVU0_ARAHY|nr:hypothetical protein Ahy_A08g039281 [Arachis hypogaea]
MLYFLKSLLRFLLFFNEIDDDITIVIHHGGSFETKEDGEVVYVKDQIEQFFGLEEDTMDVFSIRNYYKVLGYDNLKECLWLVPRRPLKTGLRALSHDKELLEMCCHAKNNEGVMHVYLEHGSTEPKGDEVPQLIPMTPNPKTPVSDTILNPSSSQPKSKPIAQINSSPTAQPTSDPTPKSTTSTPPSQPISMPLFRLCSSKPKINKLEKSIPTTTIKKSTTNVKKNSKSTPRKGTVKKVTIPSPKRVTRSASRSAPIGKKVVGKVPTVTLSNDSSDSYESAEDELYRPGPEAFENSSDDDSDSEVAAARTKELKMKKNKGKHKICLEDLCEEDELIVQNSDKEVDLGQVIGKEMKTLPNSDEESDVDDDIVAALAAAAAVVIAKEKEKGSNANDAKEEIVLSQIPFSLLDFGEQEQVTIHVVLLFVCLRLLLQRGLTNYNQRGKHLQPQDKQLWIHCREQVLEQIQRWLKSWNLSLHLE